MAYYTNFTWVEKDLLKKCEDSYVMIARPREYNFAMPVSANKSIRMFFEAISDEPEPIITGGDSSFISSNYIAFDINQDEEFLPYGYDFDSYDVYRKADECEDFFRGKLVIFTPIYKINNDGQSFKNMQIISIVEDKNAAYYNTVPKFDYDSRRIAEVLESEEYFVIEDYNNKLVLGADFIICGDYAYRFKNNQHLVPFLTGSELRDEAWKCTGGDEIVKVKISEIEGHDGCIVDIGGKICLVDDRLYNYIINTENYIEIGADESVDYDQSFNNNIEDNDENDESIQEDQELDEEDEIKASNASEIMFINGLNTLTRANNLVYDYKDLVNFHTSVKTNPLTIISGMSGTGKTQLAYNYARMLDLSEDNNTLLFIPISPSYSEPSDILGYMNPISKEYVSSETGLVDFLIHANNNKNKMHMVIFDEMNLSQVEYWFSPFISILEKDMGDRYLKLYDSNTETNSKYPSKIKIDSNVIFVGTVNIDETTKDFSDRLLDRTFVVTLNKIKFKDVYNELNSKSEEKKDINSAICSDASVFISWNKKYNNNFLNAFDESGEELEFLDEFSELLSSTLHSDGISHRVLRNIGNYLLNIPSNDDGPVIDRKEAFDIIINQTVMQKIRGTESQLSQLISLNDDIQTSPIVRLLDKYLNISEFKNVRKAINKKSEDLKINGYTN